MRLQDQIFEFGSLDEKKLKLKEITKSNLVKNDTITKTTLGELFKSEIRFKSDTRIKGFSILQFVNEKGEIEIDKSIYKVSFIKDGIPFKINSCVNSQMQRSDRKLTDKEVLHFGKLISESTSIDEVKVAAAAKSTSAKAEDSASSTEEQAKAGAEVKLFTPENYNEDRDELVSDGYNEYETETKSNYRILIKEDEVKLVELKKDDYKVLDTEKFDIEIDDKNKSFTIKPL